MNYGNTNWIKAPNPKDKEPKDRKKGQKKENMAMVSVVKKNQKKFRYWSKNQVKRLYLCLH